METAVSLIEKLEDAIWKWRAQKRHNIKPSVILAHPLTADRLLKEAFVECERKGFMQVSGGWKIKYKGVDLFRTEELELNEFLIY